MNNFDTLNTRIYQTLKPIVKTCKHLEVRINRELYRFRECQPCFNDLRKEGI